MGPLHTLIYSDIGIANLQQDKKRLHRQCVDSNRDHDNVENRRYTYIRLRNQVKYLIRQAKRSFERDIANDAKRSFERTALQLAKCDSYCSD